MIGQYADIGEKTFLITGASSGIGKAIAIALSSQNANVIITGRDKIRLDETLSQLNTKAISISTDLTNAPEREELIKQLPNLDGICHAAGIINPLPLRFIDAKEFEKIFSINTIAPIILTSSLLRNKKIKAGASILFISSIASDFAHAGSGLYSSSKAAIEAFSRSITLEHAAKRIRSNCLKPALVETPILEKAKELSPLEVQKNYASQYPLGIGTPEDIAAAALFFLSDASRWISSTSLVMDGGMAAKV